MPSGSIAEWLTDIGLPECIDLFERERIDLLVLPDLTELDLEKLGLPLGSRKRLLRGIESLKAPAAPSVSSSPAPDSYTPGHLARKILTSRSALEGERKQVTVLFCDIAESTALALLAGAEAMHVILNRFFQLAMEEVHRYEGTVNQFLGDGFMALFGAPVAHEDHARRGVLSALAIRRALADRQGELGLPPGGRLSVRIGLHTGPVVVGSIGDNLRMDYTAIGDTTHLAARLEQAGSPGQILMSEATARLVRGYVTSDRLPPLMLKGMPDPVNFYEVLGPGNRRSRLDENRSLSPFVGRDRELGILREALQQAQAGRGQVVGIVGEPGVGKSRLLFEFRRLLQGYDATYLEGWCLSFGQSIPYLPLQDVLRTSCGITAADSPAQVAERIKAVLQQAGLAHDELAPYLMQALGMTEGTESLTQISPETVKARTLHTLQRLALAQSQRRTLILAIEDLHWIDRTSEEFLARLIESLAGAPILLVTTTRPGYTAPWLGHSYVTQVPVRVLSPDAARQIVDAATEASGLPEATLTSILNKGEGNPFFLEELLLALREQGGLEAGQALPDTIQGVIAARIDRLAEPAKRLLQTAAVMGREFPLRLLESVVDSSTSDLAQLDALKQLEFFYQRLEPEGPVYVFKHALTQDVAYESLLTTRKEVLHAAVGGAIEAVHPGRLEEHYEILAHHYSHSRNAEKAIEYLNHANLKAQKANAVADAQAYFNEALRQYGHLAETPDRKRARVALIARQAPVFMLQMKMVEYETFLRDALADAESTGDEGLLGKFLACLGHCLWFTARYPEAIETCLRAARLAERCGQLDGAGHGLMLVQWSHLYAGSFPDVVKVEPQAIRALERAPNLRYRMWALTASAWAYANMGQWSLAIERSRQAIEEGEAVSDSSIVAFSAWILAIVYVQKGDFDEAIRYATASVDQAPTLGDKAWGSTVLLWAMARRAADSEVITKLEQYWRLYQGTGFKGLIAFAGDVLAEGYLKAGRLEDAAGTADAVNELCEASGQQYWRGVALRLGAEARMQQSQDPLQVRHQLELSLRLLESSAAKPDIAHTHAALARLFTRIGQVGSAREHWEMALHIYQRLQMTPHEQAARAAVQQLG